jgi:hypothetical protein
MGFLVDLKRPHPNRIVDRDLEDSIGLDVADDADEAPVDPDAVVVAVGSKNGVAAIQVPKCSKFLNKFPSA